jgi:hypothetical protein
MTDKHLTYFTTYLMSICKKIYEFELWKYPLASIDVLLDKQLTNSCPKIEGFTVAEYAKKRPEFR